MEMTQVSAARARVAGLAGRTAVGGWAEDTRWNRVKVRLPVWLRNSARAPKSQWRGPPVCGGGGGGGFAKFGVGIRRGGEGR